MFEIQQKIKDFNDAREWSDPSRLKDYLLNMNEEIGEFWNIIKWVGVEKQQELLAAHKDEAEDFIGDMLYLVLKIAYMCNVNAEIAIQNVMEEYEMRFPIDKVKGHHANIKAGGFDGKHIKE